MQRSLISEDEEKAYGQEVLSVMARKAQEAVGPALHDLQLQAQRIRSELQKVKSNDVYGMLDQYLPEWRRINTSQEFLQWLSYSDPYSGYPKSTLLRAAFDSGDAGRVLTIFRGFLGDTQPTAHAPRMSADEKPVISAADIDRFYSDVAHGRYTGPEREKNAREAQIHAAVREGRVRRQ